MEIILMATIFGSVVWIIQKTANMIETQQDVQEAEQQSNASMILLLVALVAFVGLVAL